MKRFLFAYSVLSIAFLGCSKNSLSERDSRLQQIRNQAEIKRAELTPITGEYDGLFWVDGSERPLTVYLEVRDIPTAVDGFVDPVLIPVLAGFLYLDKPPEHTIFGIESSDFDAQSQALTLVLSNQNLGKLHVKANVSESTIKGNWLAQNLGGTGEFEVTRLSEGGER